MKKPNVYVTRMLPEAAIALLKQHCDVEINRRMLCSNARNCWKKSAVGMR